jgi:hypothetical protein
MHNAQGDVGGGGGEATTEVKPRLNLKTRNAIEEEKGEPVHAV